MQKKSIIGIIVGSIVVCIAFLGFYKQLNPEAYFGKKRLKFGATYMNMNNPFFIKLNEGIKQVVEDQNGKLIALDSQLEIDKQISQVEDLIMQRVDVIFLNPVDWKKIKPALIKAKAANIPVIVIDSPVFDDSLVDVTVVSDNYSAGVLCAVDFINKTKGRGNIMILEHPTAKSAIDRIQGFEDTIGKYKDIKIIARQSSNGQLEKAMGVMEDMLKSNYNKDSINAIMCLNDPTALGALAAIENTIKNSGILIYGIDGSDDAIKMIENGKLTATAAQFPVKIGNIAAETAYKKLSGEKVEKYIKVPVKLITKENMVYP